MDMKLVPIQTLQIPIFSLIKILFVRKIKFPENFLFFSSGRGAAKWLLSQLQLYMKRKLSVGAPCYACFAVFQAVKESGNLPVLLDIDPLCFHFTDELNEKIKKLDVLIWINYFGFKYSSILKEIRARFPQLIIVEDCSHVDMRNYFKISCTEHYSDYTIFSFNFEKPITAGGGGLLVPLGDSNNGFTKDLFNSYSQLPSSKLGLHNLIHRYKYSFSFPELAYSFLKKIVSGKVTYTFKPDEIPIKSFSMHIVVKKIVYAQFLRKSVKRMMGKYTMNYFSNMPELLEKYSFGALSYYPVILFPEDNDSIYYKNKFLVWRNFNLHYKYFDIDISEESFPLTFDFISRVFFLPAVFFRNNDKRKVGFPLDQK
jgi:hypothetical protein